VRARQPHSCYRQCGVHKVSLLRLTVVVLRSTTSSKTNPWQTAGALLIRLVKNGAEITLRDEGVTEAGQRLCAADDESAVARKATCEVIEEPSAVLFREVDGYIPAENDVEERWERKRLQQIYSAKGCHGADFVADLPVAAHA